MTKKFLLLAVSLILTVSLAFILFNIFGKGKKTLDNVSKNQERAEKEAEEYEIVKYDGFKVNGSIAVSYTKTMVSTYELPVTVVNAAGTSVVVNDSTLLPQLRQVSSAYYINPYKDFLCEVHRDANDAIDSIKLTEQP